jgi:flagellar protein FliO/FliZ
VMQGKTIAILQKTIDVDDLFTETNEKVNQGSSSIDNFLQLVGLVILLIIILIAAYYTSKFVGGIKLGQVKNSNFQVIDSYRISPNKALQIIKIGNKFIVISINKDTVNYITELNESDILTQDLNSKERQSFKHILEKLRMNKE